MENDKNWVSRTVLFLTSQTISLFGSSLVQFAIIGYVALTTKSGVMMTITTLCGFLMAAWGGLKSRIHTIAWACIAFGILTFSMGMSSIFRVYLAVIFITGVALPAYNISSMTLLQERVRTVLKWHHHALSG